MERRSERGPAGHAGWCVAALALLALSAPARADRQCLDDADVCLDTHTQEDVTRFVATNASAMPYSFRVSLSSLKNLKPSGAVPFRGVVGPGEKLLLGTLAPEHPEHSTRWESSWRAAPGSMLARHDDGVRYRMPFGGSEPRRLSQGVGGTFSHTGSTRYSFDFSMPAGTPVLAARPGRVVTVRDGYLDSGRRKVLYDEANAVEILHADGTIGTYSHLRKGIPVEVGQDVAAGQELGVSGDSGFSTGPHLHFMVWRRLADLSWSTVPVRFDDGSSGGFVPREGAAYVPACAGPRCALPVAQPVPASPSKARGSGAARRDDGACICTNGAIIHVDLPCRQVCGG